MRTQAAAQQYRNASCRTEHGRRAAPRRHEVISDASLPRTVADRSSACPAHRSSTQGLGGISRQARRTKRVLWWCGMLWYWTSPSDASVGSFSFAGTGGALPFQRIVGLTPSGHCATQSTRCRVCRSSSLPAELSQRIARRHLRPFGYFVDASPIKLLAAGSPNETPGALRYPSLYQEVKHSVKRLGLVDRVTPYQTRRSGPSIHRAGKLAWKTISSVLSTTKATRSLQITAQFGNVQG